MVIAIALIGGFAGFLAAITSIFLGHSFMQALLVYWQVGTLIAVALVVLQVTLQYLRKLGQRTDVRSAFDQKPTALVLASVSARSDQKPGI